MRFSDYHPGINFCFFAAALAGTILFRHPVYLILPLRRHTLVDGAEGSKSTRL